MSAGARQGAVTIGASSAPAMSEGQLQEAILQLAPLLGWLAYHTRDSRGSQAGFPDLVLVRPPRIIIAELKGPSGRTSPDQDTWLHRLENTGQAIAGAVKRAEQGGHGPLDAEPALEVYLWRPADWSAIQAALR